MWRKWSLAPAVFTVTVASALGACGGESSDDSAPTCSGNFSACGGDVVGTWELSEICFTGDVDAAFGGFDEPECAGAMTGVRFTPSATYEFRADGTYEVVGTARFTFGMTVTAACGRALAGDPSFTFTPSRCRSLEESVNDTAAEPDSSLESAQCALSGTACVCSVTGRPMDLSDAGTYETQGTRLLAGGELNDYCVDGDELTVGQEDIDGTGLLSAVMRMKRGS